MQNSESGTLKVLLRLVPFAKKAIPRLILGMFAGIAAHMFALAIPQLLQDLVNSLVAGGLDALLPAVGLILFLGVLEALFVLLRRWLVLTPGTYVEADMRNKLYFQGGFGFAPDSPLAEFWSCAVHGKPDHDHRGSRNSLHLQLLAGTYLFCGNDSDLDCRVPL